MNKKISYICLGLCLALSVEGFAAPRGASRQRNLGGGKSRVVSNSLVSGYIDKYFKNTTITLVEKRSVELEPLMFPDAIAKITKTASADGQTLYPAQYGLCIPCSEVILEGEEPDKDGVYKFKDYEYTEGLSCFELNPNGRNYKLTTKSGASSKNKCGDKIRVTIVDKRSAALPEIDSAILRIVPNSSAYDYASIGMDEDTEIYDLIKNYKDAKQEAKNLCEDAMEPLKTIRGWVIAATATSGVASATGIADTIVRTGTTISMSKAAASDGEEKGNGDAQQNDNAEPNAQNAGAEPNPQNAGDGQTNGDAQQNVGDGQSSGDGAAQQNTSAEPNGTGKKNNTDTQNKKDGVRNAQVILSSVSGAGNLGTMVSASVSAQKVLDAIDKVKACKNAATKLHNAGIALEAGLEEITSLD